MLGGSRCGDTDADSTVSVMTRRSSFTGEERITTSTVGRTRPRAAKKTGAAPTRRNSSAHSDANRSSAEPLHKLHVVAGARDGRRTTALGGRFGDDRLGRQYE